MKKLIFDELILVSHREKAGLKIAFDRNLTILSGPNRTGKSSVVKSIYHTLGAEPQTIHPLWTRASVSSSLRFSIEGVSYRIIRNSNSFFLFDSADKFIRSFSRITTELAPYFAELFTFPLQLTDREGNETQATPALLFMPFYLDQDDGWTKAHDSFRGLGQFARARNDSIMFHSGIRPSEYFQAKNIVTRSRAERGEWEAERNMVDKFLQKTEAKLAEIDFDLDIGKYQFEIEQLLKRCERLRKEEERVKALMTQSFRRRKALEDQQGAAEASLLELQRDREFASADLPEQVICPTCLASYDNDFSERFGIAVDEDRCISLIKDLKEALSGEIKVWERNLATSQEILGVSSEIEHLLSIKKEKVTLSEVLRREGHGEIADELRERLATIDRELGELFVKIETAEKRMMEVEKDAKKIEIKKFYFDEMRRMLPKLGLGGLIENSYKQLDCSIKETGSDQPRALLAYTFALVRTIASYTTSTFAPLIIDSPNQQNQDNDNWSRICEFIRDELPADSQAIVVVGETVPAELSGKVVELSSKKSALRSDEYPSLAAEINSLLGEAYMQEFGG